MTASPLSFVFSPQPLQELFLSCDVFEVLLGGGRGAGKSVALLADFAGHAERYGPLASGLIVRREATELRDLIKLALTLFKPLGYSYNGSSKTLRSPKGATLVFDHLWDESDASSYQGWSLTWVGIEEAGEYPDSKAIDLLRATLRGPVPCYLRMTANPGGPGNAWLKARFVDPAPRGFQVLTEILDGVRMERVFIPCTPYDNPANLKANPRYVAQLKQIGSAELQAAWILGEWNISVGCYFSEVWSPTMQVLAPFDLPSSWRLRRGFDWGSSSPSGLVMGACLDNDHKLNQGGRERWLRRGSLVVFGEWYPLAVKNGVEIYNKGAGLDNDAQGAAIVRASKGRNFSGCVADPSIFAEPGQASILSNMQAGARKAGGALVFSRADNARVPGWTKIREMLRNALSVTPEGPGLYIFSTCTHLIRTLPALLRDKTDLDDLDTDQEDHLADALRYLVNSYARSGASIGGYS